MTGATAYGAYSGSFGWFSSVPKDWEVSSVRRALKERKKKNEGQLRDEYLSLVSGVGIIPYAEKGDIGNKKSDDLSNCKLVENGDFVINSMNFLIGGFGRSSYKGVCSSVYVVAEPNEEEFEPRFLMRIFQVGEFQRHVGRLGNGIMALRMSIGWDELKNQPLPNPPRPAQVRIADFLDDKTARIDALIAEKERLVAALGNYQSAEISRLLCVGVRGAMSHATGRLFAPAAPAHWRVVAFKRALLGMSQGWSPQCENQPAESGQWGVLKVGCVNGNRFNSMENKALPSTLEPDLSCILRKNDVLVSRANTRELVGLAALVEEDYPNLLLCDKLYRLQLRRDWLLPGYAVLLLRSEQSRRQIELGASGASSSMQNISQDVLRELVVAIPPLDEQVDILASAEKVRTACTSLIEHVGQHIARLREYRSSLISAAVTGQIKI